MTTAATLKCPPRPSDEVAILPSDILLLYTDGVTEAMNEEGDEFNLDRLLIERMPMEKVTYVVRGHPILNDALMEDAQIAGLTDLVEVIDNGPDAPGTILETCSDAFRQQFERADLIVAKGQGNFESLSDTERPVFFLVRPKCAVLARHLNCELGRLMVIESGRSPAGAQVV